MTHHHIHLIHQSGYSLSTDPQDFDIDLIHHHLSNECYWCRGIDRPRVEKSIAASRCYSLFDPDGNQIGFARVVTDGATFSYLGDVFILQDHQGKGLSKWMMEQIFRDPAVCDVRRFMLFTADAHTLYEKYGFSELSDPSKAMAKTMIDPYL
ncbi:MAG: GNAT family N-acetyltransferase [Cohaesibacteraceae bacterium]|nr:GNAT family N-acetyltransferase [Cohaesibacteraceae bacterium]